MIKRRIPLNEATKDKRTLSKGEKSELSSLRVQHKKDMANDRHDIILKRYQDHKAGGKPKGRSQQMHTALTAMHTAFAQEASKAKHNKFMDKLGKVAKAAAGPPPTTLASKPPPNPESSRKKEIEHAYRLARDNHLHDVKIGKVKRPWRNILTGTKPDHEADAHKKGLEAAQRKKDEFDKLDKLTKEETMSEENKNENEVEKVEQPQEQPSVMDRYARFISGQAKKLEYSTFGHNRELNKEEKK
jgi:hypothetical protein